MNWASVVWDARPPRRTEEPTLVSACADAPPSMVDGNCGLPETTRSLFFYYTLGSKW
jgi:hypothetical protein